MFADESITEKTRSAMNNIDMSIVIVNYNSGVLLRDCLSSIYQNTKHVGFEVNIIDNNSSDMSIKLAQEEFKDINLIENKCNIGFAKANNQGIKEARGRYVLLLNPDTIISSEVLASMVNFMDSHKDIGILGPKILNSDGTLQLSCRSFLNLKTVFFTRDSLLNKVFPNNRYSRKYLLSVWHHNDRREVDWVSGACMMIRKEVFDNIGLMDDNFYMYCEDVDFCYRAKKAGWKVFYLPEVEIIHHAGSCSKGSRYTSIINHHKSMVVFYKKHFKRNLIMDIIITEGIITRAAFCLLKAMIAGKFN